jgi:hypothetical protein
MLCLGSYSRQCSTTVENGGGRALRRCSWTVWPGFSQRKAVEDGRHRRDKERREDPPAPDRMKGRALEGKQITRRRECRVRSHPQGLHAYVEDMSLPHAKYARPSVVRHASHRDPRQPEEGCLIQEATANETMHICTYCMSAVRTHVPVGHCTSTVRVHRRRRVPFSDATKSDIQRQFVKHVSLHPLAIARDSCAADPVSSTHKLPGEGVAVQNGRLSRVEGGWCDGKK